MGTLYCRTITEHAREAREYLSGEPGVILTGMHSLEFVDTAPPGLVDEVGRHIIGGVVFATGEEPLEEYASESETFFVLPSGQMVRVHGELFRAGDDVFVCVRVEDAGELVIIAE